MVTETTCKLSRAARERIAYEGQSFWGDPEEYIPRMAAEALERPSNSAWWDDDMYTTHSVMFAYSPLADDILGQSNYRSILRDLTAEFPGDDRVAASGFGSWTYAHFDAIKIRVLNKRGRITPEFALAAVIARGLQDYPVYDESDYSELEMEETHKAFLSEWQWTMRNYPDSIRDDADIRAAVEMMVFERYYGHSSPGAVDGEWITEMVQRLPIAPEEFHAAEHAGDCVECAIDPHSTVHQYRFAEEEI